MELKQKVSRDLFEVSFVHEGCEVEIYFYTYENDNHSMLFSAGYLNNIATDSLVIKLTVAANQYASDEKIGFIGILSDDHFTRVERCVDMAFQVWLKHVKMVESLKKEASMVEKIVERDDFAILFDTSCQIKDSLPEERNFRRSRRAKNPFVDLTAIVEEEEEHDEVEVADESFLDVVCSEILSEGKVSFCRLGWDERVEDEMLSIPVQDKELFDFWLNSQDFLSYPNEYETVPSLQVLKLQMDDITMTADVGAFTTEQRTARLEKIAARANNTALPGHSQRWESTSASQHYIQKASRDRGDFNQAGSFQNRNTSREPQLGRGIEPGGSLILRLDRDFKSPLPKSKLFERKDFQNIKKRLNYSDDEHSQSSIPKYHTEKKVFSDGFKIPRKERSPERSSNPSPLPVYSRPSINSLTPTTLNRISRTDRIMANVAMPVAGSADSPSGYDFRHQDRLRGASERKKEEVINLIDDEKDDAIQIDDDDENSDVNNNDNKSQYSKRKLYNPQSPQEPKRNRIFKTKEPGRNHYSKPNFDHHDGNSNRRN